ncbi:hypothetical protein HPP92_004911 [Vanilla planifolia]|uniref:NAC domain-containing protein n=1 Tax=Vanilla planifolia TaxID=51239 RepID=A0A835VBM6_VANPL|nr:hypothetical protein HPP92_004911 [Vanilla planifolia]
MRVTWIEEVPGIVSFVAEGGGKYLSVLGFSFTTLGSHWIVPDCLLQISVKMEALKGITLPPGFGFHPTDVELVFYYLKRKNMGLKADLDVIPELEIYKFEPWDLPACCHIPTQDSKWHFFTSRDRKYPNGLRSNRATAAGYWKSTGKDRNIRSQNQVIGTKKTLVFHEGRPPYGKRTDWIMHEYDAVEKENTAHGMKGTYVLCRVTKRDGFSLKGDAAPAQTKGFEGLQQAVMTESMQEVVLQEESSPSENTEDFDAWLQELIDPSFIETVDFSSAVLPASAEPKIEPKAFWPMSNGPLIPKDEPLDLGFLPDEILSLLQDNFNPMPDITDIIAAGPISAVPPNQLSSLSPKPSTADLSNNSADAEFTGIELRRRGRSVTESSQPRIKLQLKTSKMESRNIPSVCQTMKSAHIDLRTSSNIMPRQPTTNHPRRFINDLWSFPSPLMSGMDCYFFGACMMGTAALIIYFLFRDSCKLLGSFAALKL